MSIWFFGFCVSVLPFHSLLIQGLWFLFFPSTFCCAFCSAVGSAVCSAVGSVVCSAFCSAFSSAFCSAFDSAFDGAFCRAFNENYIAIYIDWRTPLVPLVVVVVSLIVAVDVVI